MKKSKSLQGHFLVASPHLMDPNFARTVVLSALDVDSGAGLLESLGVRGTPGELCGGASSASPIGSIEENTVRGIFGTSRTPLGTLPAMPVAAESEIRLGEATILSTVSTGGVRSYDAVITRIARSGDGGKLTLTITDGDLLAVTGGIVQGMSGSPILQNGKIVGAVTHVLVNDPTKGYGISMENMLEAAS